MKYFDAFSGIGGFRQGFQEYGECIGHCDINKQANITYEAIYGNERTFTDITKITDEEWLSLIDVDVFLGGIPCTSFSIAGKRKGFDDERGIGSLFFDYLRGIKLANPSFVFIENVKGLVSHDKGRTIDTMVKELNSLGYKVDFEVLNATDYGIPQKRDRVFIVGVKEDLYKEPLFPLLKKESPKYIEDILEDLPFSSIERLEREPKLLTELEISQYTKPFLTNNKQEVHCINSKKSNGKQPSQQDRIYDNLGILPTISASLGGRYLIFDKNHKLLRKITPKEAWRSQGFSDIDYEKAELVTSVGQLYKQAGNAIPAPLSVALANAWKETYSN